MKNTFSCSYTITYGITLGIALSEDIVTMYCFYEMLTLVTLPLILHTLSREAILASRTYLYYSLGGAAFAFIGMIFILNYGVTSNFVPGGVLDPPKTAGSENLLLLILRPVLSWIFGQDRDVAVWSRASEGRCGSDTGYGAAPCGGRRQGGRIHADADHIL